MPTKTPPAPDPEPAAVVASEQAPEVPPAEDETIPVNERAVADAGKAGTEQCPHCGATKLKAKIPGQETPEEYCPSCGRGADAPVVA